MNLRSDEQPLQGALRRAASLVSAAWTNRWPASLRRIVRAPVLPVGLDLGANAVRLLQLRAVANTRPRVVASASASFDTGEGTVLAEQAWLDAAGRAVSRLLAGGRFAGNRVTLALPRSMVQFKTVRVTSADGDLHRALASEAMTAMGVDLTLGRHTVHFLPGDTLRRGAEAHQEGLLVVADRDRVDRFVACVHHWGVEVAAVELEPAALYRCVRKFSRRRRDDDDAHVLVDVGSRSSRVVIGRGGRISFLKTIAVGRQHFQDRLASRLDLDPRDADALLHGRCSLTRPASGEDDEARDRADAVTDAAVASATKELASDFARDVSLCLRYYGVTFRGRRPAGIVLTGSVAGEPTFVSHLGRMLPLPVTARRPWADLGSDGTDAAPLWRDSEAWSLAVGLALRFAPDHLAGRAGPTREEQEALDATGDAAEDWVDATTLADPHSRVAA